jgi:hypothetical protein
VFVCVLHPKFPSIVTARIGTLPGPKIGTWGTPFVESKYKCKALQ